MITVRLKARDGHPYSSTERLDGFTGLDVATEPKHLLSFRKPPFLRTDNQSKELAINGAPAGGGLIVWNGTGVSDTGGDWTRSGPGSETVGSMYSGTNGLDTGSLPGDTLILFDTTSTDISSYPSLSFWIKTIVWPQDSYVEIEWHLSNNRVSNRLRISNYITVTIGSWQQVVIPLSDFSLTTSNVDRLRLKHKRSGQHHHYDDIELSSGGSGPYVFRVSASDEQIVSDADDLEDTNRPLVEIQSIDLVLAAGSTGWLPADFATINGGLTSGLLIRHRDYHSGQVFWSVNLLDNMDLLSLDIVNSISFFDADRLLLLRMNMDFARPQLQSTVALELVLSDNLASLVSLKAYAVGGLR